MRSLQNRFGLTLRRITDSKALGYLLIQFMPNTNALYYDVVVSNTYGPTIVHLHKGKPSAFMPVQCPWNAA